MRTLMVIALSLAIAPAHAEQKADIDLEKLQGKWESVSVVDDGKLFDKEDQRVKFEIQGDRLIYSKDTVHLFKLDSTKKPKHLDLVETKGEKKMFPGIFSFEGDGFILCLDKAGKDRPKAFESKEGSGYRLMVFKRVK